jgi:molybdopterin biosynthesis enzyme
MSRDVHPNMVMVALQNLIETPLYKDLNVTIHHQWASIFALHVNSKFQIPTYDNSSFDNLDFDNEEIHQIHQ